jgi:rhodanese-related sulfurtransferase
VKGIPRVGSVGRVKRPDISVTRRPRLAAAVLVVAGLAVLPACGGEDAAEVPGTPASAGAESASPTLALVSPEEGQALVEDGAVLIDVRTPEEFAEAHIEGALLVDVSDPAFDEAIAQLPADGTYVVYCRSGNRSAAATARMAELGFQELYDMGGIIDWVDAGLPVVTG